MPKTEILYIECTYLLVYKLGKIPSSVREVLLNEYIIKEKIGKNGNKYEYQAQKIVLNGVAGNSQRIVKRKCKFKSEKKNASIAPQWGIFLTAYVRQIIINIGSMVSGWKYSDTDSIICYNNDRNVRIIAEYNAKIRAENKVFCEENDEDYNVLKHLGTFDVECLVDRMIIFSPKHYIYEGEDSNGEYVFEVKSSGSTEEATEAITPEEAFATKVNDEGFEEIVMDMIPVGERKIGCVDNGYYEKPISEMEVMMLGILNAEVSEYIGEYEQYFD